MDIKIVELKNFPRNLTRWVSWLNNKDVVAFSTKKIQNIQYLHKKNF